MCVLHALNTFDAVHVFVRLLRAVCVTLVEHHTYKVRANNLDFSYPLKQLESTKTESADEICRDGCSQKTTLCVAFEWVGLRDRLGFGFVH